MGYPCYGFHFLLPKPLVLILVVLDYICFIVELPFYYLGLLSEMPLTPWEDGANLLSTTEVEPLTTPSMIKERLQVMQYGSLVKRYRGECKGREAVCMVCLEGLEARDEVRELGNCCHGFHKGCIDRWIEVGQVICPLCRSQLLPLKGRDGRGPLISFVTKILGDWYH